MLGLFLAAFPNEASAQIAPPPAPVKKIVDRLDIPVVSGVARRTWTWGEYFAAQSEPYQESPGGSRQVFYYDKGRLEITNPQIDNNNEYYATSGLLLREMITGQVQLGDSNLSQREPANVVLAGDNPPLLETAPTYADLAELVSFDGSWKSADLTGTTAGLFLIKGGTVDSSFTRFSNIKYGQYDATTGHNVADIFLKFMNSSGPIFDGSRTVNGPLYNPLFVFGRPISEPYWTQVTVSGTKRYVLLQAFERRLLTYTPENSPEFQVELGNIGRAYYQWRYGQAGPAPAIDPDYTRPVSTPAFELFNQSFKNFNNLRSLQYSQYTNFEQIINIRYEAPNKQFYLEQDSATCGPGGYYAEITIETRLFANCLVNNNPLFRWVYIDVPTPFRWPAYNDMKLNDINLDYSFGPETNIGNEAVRNVIRTGLDFQGYRRASITGISKNSGLPLEGSTTYEFNGQKQIFNTKFDSFNQNFNIQSPAGAVPFDPSSGGENQPVANNFFPSKFDPFTLERQSGFSQLDAVPGELLVKFRDGQTGTFSQNLSQPAGIISFEAGKGANANLLKVKPEVLQSTLAALRIDPNVEYAEPNYLYHYNSVREPNDEQYHLQWYLKTIKAPRAWSLNTGQFMGGSGLEQIKVAVVDSGIVANHPDLQPNLLGSYDKFNGTAPKDDPVGHGTFVAGIIAAQGNNDQFGTGIDWKAQILSYRTGDRRGLTCKAISESLRDATDQGARVINMSFGSYSKCQSIVDAIAYASSKNVVLVAAAGNEASSQPSYPASLPNVISVAALGRLGTPASFSNYGSTITLAAPGVNICSTARAGGKFGCGDGTSFSSPIVAGVVALMLSVNSNLTPQKVREILIATATPAPGKASGQLDDRYGYGTVNAYAAVRAVATSQNFK